MCLTASASARLMTSLRSQTSYPSGGTPPIHMPLRLEAAIFSRIRSPVTSCSNRANESRSFSVSRPIEVVVLKTLGDCNKRNAVRVEHPTIFAKSASERVRRSTL